MMREGWRIGTLASLVEAIVEHVQPDPDDERPYVALEHIAQGEPRLLGWDRAAVATSAKAVFRRGDVLFGKLRPNLKKAVMAPFDGVCSTDILVLRAKTGTEPAFVLNLAHWPPFQEHAVSTASGTKMPRTSWSLLAPFDLEVPPLPEQRKIAAILSSVDDAIEATQAVIDQLGAVKKAMMAEVLTRGLPGRHTRFKQTDIGEVPEEWDVVPLGEITSHVTSGSRGWAQYYAPSGALFIRITNLKRGTTRLDLADRQHVQLPSDSAEGARTRVVCGDVLISITADIGIVGLVPMLGMEESYINQHIALIRLDRDRCDPCFVASFLAGDAGQAQIRRLNDGGAKAGLNLTSIRQLLVALPPMGEQEALARSIEEIEDRLSFERAEFEALRELKSALLSSLLTGEIRVTPDKDAP